MNQTLKSSKLHNSYEDISTDLTNMKIVVELMIANEKVAQEREQHIPISTLLNTGYLLFGYLHKINEHMDKLWDGYKELKSYQEELEIEKMKRLHYFCINPSLNSTDTSSYNQASLSSFHSLTFSFLL